MKRLFFIGGPMGIGKSLACKLLKTILPDVVFLNGVVALGSFAREGSNTISPADNVVFRL